MPISSAYKQTGEVASQPWNTTKSRRLSTTLPPSLDTNRNEESRRKRPLSASNNRSNHDNFTKQPFSKPASATGSFEEPLSVEQNLNTATKTMTKKPLKRRETLPEFSENSFTLLPKFKRSNSDSLLEPCESGSKRKIRRTAVSDRIRKYRKRYGVKPSSSGGTRSKKVEPHSKLPVHKDKLWFHESNQTPNSLGQRVLCVVNKQIRSGVVHYLGCTHFSSGQWCGIVLDEPLGKNDGCVKGIRYFTCPDNYGIFVHLHKVRTVNKPSCETDDFVFRESEEKLARKTSAYYNNTTSMNCSKVDRLDGKDSLNVSHTEGLTKKWSKSLTDGTYTQTNNHKISDSEYSCEAIQSELTRTNSLSKLREEMYNSDVHNGSGNGSSYSNQLQNNLNSDYNDGDKIGDILEKHEATCCESDHKETDQILKSSGNMLNNDNNITEQKRSYSVDHFTSVNSKFKHDLNSLGPHAALERNSTIDAFIQDKYCSCPNLVPTQHLSSALEACIDLGRQELESHSEKSTPLEEHSVACNELNDENDIFNRADSNESETKYDNYNVKNLGRSNSLPLVLVEVRKMSETESLFWSAEKLTGLVLKEERSASWPALSTSACRLDLRTDDKIADTAFMNGDEANTTQDTLTCENVENIVLNVREEEKERTQTFPLKKQSAIENLAQSDTESFSRSESQTSLSSIDTNFSKKARKGCVSSVSSARSNTKKVPGQSQRNSKLNKKKETKNMTSKSGKTGAINSSPFKLVKRHTVSNLQKHDGTAAPSTTRPSVTKRPVSTLSEPASNAAVVSPSYGKSKLPTMKKAQTATPDKPVATKPPAKKVAVRPTSIPLQDAKKIPGPAPSRASSRKPSCTTQSTTQRKASAPAPSQRTSVKVDTAVKITKANSKQTNSGRDKNSATTRTTKTSITKNTKPTKTLTPQETTGSPARSPTKPHHSRLPTRKITSRSGSIESSQSHECDADAVSTGTDASDYVDGDRLSRGDLDSIPNDHYDGDRSDLESSTRSWQYIFHAPDLLTGTKEINTRSVDVQVDLDNVQEVGDDMKEKHFALEQLMHGLRQDYDDLKVALSRRDNNLLSCVILIAALCKKLHNNGMLITHLRKDLHMMESELKQTQEQLAEEEENGVKLQEEMMYIRSEHTVSIQNLKADHENTLETIRHSLNKQFGEEHAKVNEEHVKELLELNKLHAEKEVEIKKCNQKVLAEVYEKYKDEIVEIESKHSQHIDELLEEHQVEIETIKADYEEQQTNIESKLFAVTNECAALNMKLQQLKEDTERDIESRIQEAIEKYKALPAELDSIKAILDMRNEENKQLKKEKMEAQMEVDHLRKVTERVKRLEHENESLSFVVENKSKFERQLSVEHEHLKTTLDRESKKLKRLSLENEELQWKLYNSGSSPSEEIASPFSVNGSPPTAKRRSFRLSSDVDTITE